MTEAFIHRLRVRYSECDPQGVVFNANYVTYFDIALTELWREAIGPYGAMLEAGADMVVAETRVRYLAPARFDDVLEVSVAPTRLGNTAMSTYMEVRREDALVVEGEMRHVFVDPTSGGKRSIPEDVRRGLEPYLREPEADGRPGSETRQAPGNPEPRPALASSRSEPAVAPTQPGATPSAGRGPLGLTAEEGADVDASAGGHDLPAAGGLRAADR